MRNKINYQLRIDMLRKKNPHIPDNARYIFEENGALIEINGYYFVDGALQKIKLVPIIES